jgi:hypothetical protein
MKDLTQYVRCIVANTDYSHFLSRRTSKRLAIARMVLKRTTSSVIVPSSAVDCSLASPSARGLLPLAATPTRMSQSLH